MHSIHFPHFDSSIGFPKSSGASVSTEDNLKADPYFGVVNNADFPIQPRPARVAIVLWGNSKELFGLFDKNFCSSEILILL